jgi:hypothetical protein
VGVADPFHSGSTRLAPRNHPGAATQYFHSPPNLSLASYDPFSPMLSSDFADYNSSSRQNDLYVQGLVIYGANHWCPRSPTFTPTIFCVFCMVGSGNPQKDSCVVITPHSLASAQAHQSTSHCPYLTAQADTCIRQSPIAITITRKYWRCIENVP